LREKWGESVMGIASSVIFAVACTECEHRTPKRVAWLISQDAMPCEHCSEIIDLRVGENAIVIEELAEQCTIIDEKIATRVLVSFRAHRARSPIRSRG
jgi:ribosomal protein S27E